MKFLGLIFGRCAACEARDYTIAILKEELVRKENKIQEIEMRNDRLNLDIRNRLDFVTGLNRVTAPAPNNEMHSIPRRGGIQDRIARAEAAERAPEMVAKRRADFEARISTLEKPETEVVEP